MSLLRLEWDTIHSWTSIHGQSTPLLEPHIFTTIRAYPMFSGRDKQRSLTFLVQYTVRHYKGTYSCLYLCTEGELKKYSSTVSVTSALDGGGWSTPRPGRFTPGK